MLENSIRSVLLLACAVRWSSTFDLFQQLCIRDSFVDSV